MTPKIGEHEKKLFKDMKQRIDDIERLTLELKHLGEGMPVVEKNARSILSFTHALRFGVSDLAELIN